MTLREVIEVMEAFGRGGKIEYRPMSCAAWRDVLKNSEESEFNFIDNDYRIKPKPKQTVTIEKWLFEDRVGIKFIQDIEKDCVLSYCHEFQTTKVKLLDTYEVEF